MCVCCMPFSRKTHICVLQIARKGVMLELSIVPSTGEDGFNPGATLYPKWDSLSNEAYEQS